MTAAASGEYPSVRGSGWWVVTEEKKGDETEERAKADDRNALID